MFRSSRRRCASGFTLIELLVVIAIIAILAAILFPVFAQAREKARAVTCVSNMKQLGIGMMMYYQDYDEQGPITRDYKAAPENDANGVAQYISSWQLLIGPYVQKLTHDQYGVTGKGNKSIYACPDNPWSACPGFQDRPCSAYAVTSDDPPLDSSIDSGLEKFAQRCGGHWNCDKSVISDAAARCQPLGAIPAPASLIMIAEHPGEWNQLGSPNGSYVNSPIRDSGSWAYSQEDAWEAAPGDGLVHHDALHTKGWNYTFADGHTKYMRPEQTIGAVSGGTMGNPHGLWTLNPDD